MLFVTKPLVFTMLVAAQGGIPSFRDGNKLLALCEGDQAVPADCIIYIEGVADEWRFFNYLTEQDKPVCAADARGNQIRDAVVNYLKAHPENRNDPAAALISKAIMQAWHCDGDARP
jgi:Rap1a immunity proteins